MLDEDADGLPLGPCACDWCNVVTACIIESINVPFAILRFLEMNLELCY